MPAKVPNPRKVFLFGIFIQGINPFLAQTVKLPDVENDIVEHGDTNFDVKTAGKKKVSMLTVSKLSPQEGPDLGIHEWMRRIQNTTQGGGQLPSLYKTTAMVVKYGADGITIIERHIFSGVWPQKINGVELSRMSSDNEITTIDFCVDEEIAG